MAEVSTHVEAPPERVYGMISDVTRMGEWSPECYRCEWVDGADGPAVGARFKGWNRRGLARWSTTPKVVAAQPGREFAFEHDYTRWTYRLAPAGGGTDVTESYESIKPFNLPLRILTKLMGNREAQLQESMAKTLERLKASAEAKPS